MISGSFCIFSPLCDKTGLRRIIEAENGNGCRETDRYLRRPGAFDACSEGDGGI